MTAQRAEDRPSADEPVPYVLTPLGQAVTRELVTTEEAAALLGIQAATVSGLARLGRIAGVQVSRRWLLDGCSVRDYARERGPRGGPVPTVSAKPFLMVLDGRGGAAACGVRAHSAEEKAIERARRSGRLTEAMGDRLAVQLLGLTSWEVWGWPSDDQPR